MDPESIFTMCPECKRIWPKSYDVCPLCDVELTRVVKETVNEGEI